MDLWTFRSYVVQWWAKITGRWPQVEPLLWHRCFPVNFAKFLRTPFLTEHLRWLLLNMIDSDYLLFGGCVHQECLQT